MKNSCNLGEGDFFTHTVCIDVNMLSSRGCWLVVRFNPR